MLCFVYADAAFIVAPSLLSSQKGQIFAGEETRKHCCDLRSVRELQLKVPECRSILWHQEKGSGLGIRTRFCCCISSTTAIQSSTTWRGKKNPACTSGEWLQSYDKSRKILKEGSSIRNSEYFRLEDVRAAK